MALYQPSNVTPSSFTETYCVDADIDFNVSWQVNGDSGMVAYKIDIMQNTAESVLVYTTGKISLSAPFYGKDFAGNVKEFSTKLSTPTGIANGYDKGYKLKITQWWGNTDDYSVEQLQLSYFVARKTPTFSINNISSPITSRKKVFSANFFQDNGDTVEYFHWMLYNKKDLRNAVSDSGDIYGTQDIRFEYDDFFPGESFSIRCEAKTSSGIYIKTEDVEFIVDYNISNLSNTLYAQLEKDKTAANVSWNGVVVVNGRPTGDYTFGDGSIILPEGSYVEWNIANQYIPWTIIYLWNTTSGGPKLSINNGEINVTQEQDGILINKDGDQIYKLQFTFLPDAYFQLILTPKNIYFSVSVPASLNELSENIYANPNIFSQSYNGYTTYKYSSPISYDQSPLMNISIFGQQTSRYVWAIKGEIPPTLLNEIKSKNPILYRPSWTTETIMLALFEGVLQAGNVPIDYDVVEGFEIFRKSETEPLKKVAFVDLDDQPYIYDYNLKSGEKVTYYMYLKGSSKYLSQPFVSNVVCPIFNVYSLIVCDENPDFLNVAEEYIFLIDLESGSVGNNNASSVLSNFTKYPTYFVDNSNYRSGMLSSLVGMMINGEYSRDTAEIAKKIYNLSSDERPMALKDKKGNIIFIKVNGTISIQQNEKYKDLLQTVSIPWVEIDDASKYSFVQKPLPIIGTWMYYEQFTWEMLELYTWEQVEEGVEIYG
jgi:hypothetical protein